MTPRRRATQYEFARRIEVAFEKTQIGAITGKDLADVATKAIWPLVKAIDGRCSVLEYVLEERNMVVVALPPEDVCGRCNPPENP